MHPRRGQWLQSHRSWRTLKAPTERGQGALVNPARRVFAVPVLPVNLREGDAFKVVEVHDLTFARGKRGNGVRDLTEGRGRAGGASKSGLFDLRSIQRNFGTQATTLPLEEANRVRDAMPQNGFQPAEA